MSLALAGAIVALGLSTAAFAEGPGPGGGRGGGGGGGADHGGMRGPSGGLPGGGMSGPGTGSQRLPGSMPERGPGGPRDMDRGSAPMPPSDGSKPIRPPRGPVFGTRAGEVGGGFGSASTSSTSAAKPSSGATSGVASGAAGSSGAVGGSRDAYRFRGKEYVRDQGGWFETRGAQRVPVAPPVGLAVDALPPNHETRWIDGVPYFVAGDAYFVWRERERKYEIVEPPAVLPSGEQTLGP